MQHSDIFFHMDRDYSWRWYALTIGGKPYAMSTDSFFRLVDAQQDASKYVPQAANDP